jgi:asparagine synthase (glutamine-hydrolysing)
LESAANINIVFDKPGLGWRLISKGSAKLLFAGSVLGIDGHGVIRLLQSAHPNLAEIIAVVQQFKGHFGIVYQDKRKIVAVTDCIASYPIFYRSFDHVCNIATSANALGPDCTIDKSQAKAIMLSGYSVGSGTVFREISPLGHGKVVFQNGDQKNYVISNYYKYSPWREPYQLDRDHLKQKLVDVTMQSIKRVVGQASNRQIAVPLSAGRDSRLVVSALKHLGAKNVTCYSYGPRGNFEGEIARKISERLGFDWYFVEVTPKIQQKFWKTQIPKEFANRSNDFMAAPVFHDLFVTDSLLKQRVISEDALIVNGNSGDFITGNHIPMDLAGLNSNCSENNVNDLLNSMLQKHYSMWVSLRNDENLCSIKNLLMSQLETIGGMDGDKSLVALHEYLEMTNRQVKWVVKRQKIYDFFSLSWALPMWDIDFMSFWERVPLQYKLQQNLFVEMLCEQNWGGVWKDIPGNEARFVSPKWMRYCVRPFFKAIHAPLGRAHWHRFEKRFLDYWLDELGLYGPFGYIGILKENDMARNCLAPHIRAYARDMGFDEQLQKSVC